MTIVSASTVLAAIWKEEERQLEILDHLPPAIRRLYLSAPGFGHINHKPGFITPERIQEYLTCNSEEAVVKAIKQSIAEHFPDWKEEFADIDRLPVKRRAGGRSAR